MISPDATNKISQMMLQVTKDHAMRSNPDVDELTSEMRAKAAKEVLGLFMGMFSMTAELLQVSMQASFEMNKKPALSLMPESFAAGYVVAFTELMQEMGDAAVELPKNERLMAVVSMITLALS